MEGNGGCRLANRPTLLKLASPPAPPARATLGEHYKSHIASTLQIITSESSVNELMLLLLQTTVCGTSVARFVRWPQI